MLKAGKTFELLHVNKMNDRMLASPALVDGTWYFRTHGTPDGDRQVITACAGATGPTREVGPLARFGLGRVVALG